MTSIISPNALLFLALQQRIASLTSGHAPVFRFIDHDLGQLDDDVPGIAYPAVLIDMPSFTYTDLGEHIQQAEGIITLRIIFAPYAATDSVTPVRTQLQALHYYDTEQQLHQLLHCWTPNYLLDDEDIIRPNFFGSLYRVSARTSDRRRDLRIRELSYRIVYEDHSMQHQYMTLPAEMEINASFT